MQKIRLTLALLLVTVFSGRAFAVPVEVYFSRPFLESKTEIVNNLGTEVWPQDKINFFPLPGFAYGNQVVIERAPVYSIIDAGRTSQYRSWQKTVGQLLEEQQVELGEMDTVEPGAESNLEVGEEIRINRVSETEVVEYEEITHSVIEKDDPTLEKGKTVVKSEGHDGKQKLTYRVKRINGETVEKKLISKEIETPKEDRVVLHGTKVIVLSTESGKSSWTFGVTASRRYKRGTRIRVTNLENGKQVEETVGGWGPQEYTGRVLDLNIDAWEAIAKAGAGVTNVKVEELNG